MKKLLVAFSLSAAAGIAFAQATPVGLWKTIDDETKVRQDREAARSQVQAGRHLRQVRR